jgi:hypothetical protein
MQKTFSRLLFLITVPFLLGNAHSIPICYTTNGHYYERVDASVTWYQSELAAESSTYMGNHGYLATITSQAELEFIVANLGGEAVRAHWLGGYQPSGSAEPAGGWSWVTGEAWSYTNWAPFEPNNLVNGAEDGLELLWDTRYALGTWNDYVRSHLNSGYIVEYPAPEASTYWSILIGVTTFSLLAKRSRQSRTTS